jgi:hypothetical protein
VLRLVVAVGVLLAEGTAAHDGDIADVALVERAPAVRLCGGEARLRLGLRLRLRLRLRFGFAFAFGFGFGCGCGCGCGFGFGLPLWS